MPVQCVNLRFNRETAVLLNWTTTRTTSNGAAQIFSQWSALILVHKHEVKSSSLASINDGVLGTPDKIKIWHDNSGAASAWFLSHVSISCDAFTAPFYFYCNSWYDTDHT